MVENLGKQKNKNGFIGFSFALLSAFIYDLLIFQLLAIFFSYKGIRDTKTNPLLPKWKATSGMIIGFIYLFMWVYNIIF